MNLLKPRTRVARAHAMLTELGPRVERLQTQFRLDNAHVSIMELTEQVLSELLQRSSRFLETDAARGVLDRAEERCRLASEYVDNTERIAERHDQVFQEWRRQRLSRGVHGVLEVRVVEIRTAPRRRTRYGSLSAKKPESGLDEMCLFRGLLDGRHTPEEVERQIIEQCQRYSIDL